MKDLVVVLIGQHEGSGIALALSDQKHAKKMHRIEYFRIPKNATNVVVSFKRESTLDLFTIKLISQSDQR